MPLCVCMVWYVEHAKAHGAAQRQHTVVNPSSTGQLRCYARFVYEQTLFTRISNPVCRNGDDSVGIKPRKAGQSRSRGSILDFSRKCSVRLWG
jgi:hypothetical protein